MKTLFYHLLIAFTLFSCASEKDEDIIPDNVTVKFNVSVPLNVTENPFSRSTGPTLAERISKIEYMINDHSTGALIKQGSQLSNDPGFGVIILNLPAGTYKGAFAAISKEQTGTFEFVKSNYSHSSFRTFNQEFFIKSIPDLLITSTTNELSANLKRPVSGIIVNITDEVPQDVSYVKINLSTEVVGMNLSGGKITGNPGHKLDKNFSISGGKLEPMNLYMIPQTIESISLKAYNSNGEILASKAVTNLILQANKRYTISGTLFEGVGDKDFSITIDEAWDEEVNVPI